MRSQLLLLPMTLTLLLGPLVCTSLASAPFSLASTVYTLSQVIPPFFVNNVPEYLLFGGANSYHALTTTTTNQSSMQQVLSNYSSVCGSENAQAPWYPSLTFNSLLQQYAFVCNSLNRIYTLDINLTTLTYANLSNVFYYEEVKFLDLPEGNTIAFIGFQNAIEGRYNVSGNTRVYQKSAVIYFDMVANQVTRNFSISGAFGESLVSAAYYQNDQFFALGQSTDPLTSNQNVILYLYDMSQNTALEALYQFTLASDAGTAATYFKPDVYCPSLEYTVFTTPYGLIAYNIELHTITIASLSSTAYEWHLQGPWYPFGPVQILRWTDMPVQPVLDGTFFLHYDSPTGIVSLVDIKQMNSVTQLGFIAVIESTPSDYKIQSTLLIDNQTVLFNVGSNFNAYIFDFISKEIINIWPSENSNGPVYYLNDNETIQIIESGALHRNNNIYVDFIPISYYPYTTWQNPNIPSKFYFLLSGCNLVHSKDFLTGDQTSDVLNSNDICRENVTFRVLQNPNDTSDWYLSATDQWNFYLQGDDQTWNLNLSDFNVSSGLQFIDYFVNWNETLISVAGIQDTTLQLNVYNYTNQSVYQINLTNTSNFDVAKRADGSTILLVQSLGTSVNLSTANPYTGQIQQIPIQPNSTNITGEVLDIVRVLPDIYVILTQDSTAVVYNGTTGALIQNLVWDPTTNNVTSIYGDGNGGIVAVGQDDLFQVYSVYPVSDAYSEGITTLIQEISNENKC